MAYYILRSFKLRLSAYKIFEVLSRSRRCFFLDSNLDIRAGRYSILGNDPFLEITANSKPPYNELRAALARYKISANSGLPPFLGGAVGYLAYDRGLAVPGYTFGFYNSAVIIDHWKKLLYIFCAGFPEKNGHYAQTLAQANFNKICRLVTRAGEDGRSGFINKPKVKYALRSNFTPDKYIAAVKKAKEYIRNGDIYQVNLSQRFQSRTDLSDLEIYRALRRVSPANFSAYFRAGDFEILSSSPERFLSVRGNKVVTQPMKGTRARGKNKRHDARLKKELLHSAKDKAELLMIVDLERNDLGRVCSYDSIRASSLRTLEVYRTVYQTTATVEGRLRQDKDRIDLLQACFPGGSITGCPKIRAMEIIRELEPSERSIYTGALGYLSFSGNMDFNILIRTILKKKDQLYFGVGGGIVADSDPEKEYEETLVKARGIMEAIS